MTLHFVQGKLRTKDKTFVVRRSSFVVRRWSFVVRRSSLVIRRPSFVVGHSSSVVRRILTPRARYVIVPPTPL